MITLDRTRRYRLACMTLLCTAASFSWAGTLEGTAYYREQIALPPDAMFEAQLQDMIHGIRWSRTTGSDVDLVT